jgi:hypothetical protein
MTFFLPDEWASMADKSKDPGKGTSSRGKDWTREELSQVLGIYSQVKERIHKKNEIIQELAETLGRGVRGVEAQLIMFRCLDRGEEYAWGNMSTICRELWQEEMGEPMGKLGSKPPPPPKRKIETVAEKSTSDDRSPDLTPFSRLLERSFGGQDVAIAPGTEIDSFWPIGPSALGATDVCQRLINHLRESPVDQVAEWVFLVGGAGNGKSFLANDVVKKSECDLASEVVDGRAYRIYLYRSPKQRSFRLVNDATIPPINGDGSIDGALCHDLLATINEEQDLLACINRGILIGERQELSLIAEELGDKQDVIKSLVQWLVDPREISRKSTGEGLELVGGEQELIDGYYAHAQLLGSGDCLAKIHLLNMDYASLFEPVPGTDDPTIRWDADGSTPVMADYQLVPFGKQGAGREESPAFKVLNDLLTQFDDIDVGDVDPLRANVAMLREEYVQKGLVEVLRAAEIVSGQRFTYRELWGLFCIAITGYVRPEFLGAGDDGISPGEWYARVVPEDDGNELFNLVNGALQRTHMSLFGGKFPGIKKWANGQHFEPMFPSASRHVTLVDPAIDVLHSWGMPVLEAMGSIVISEDQKPSDFLFENEPGLKSAWQPFDAKLEGAILSEIRSDKIRDPDRRLLQAWYGRYLFRFYGLARGIPAFSETVSAWVENWRNARDGFPGTDDFRTGLVTLLAGAKQDGSAEVWLPILASRTTPLVKGNRDALAIAFPRDQFDKFKLNVQGDNLTLSLMPGLGGAGDSTFNDVIIDFALCRDVMCCASGAAGFTNRSHATAPRVERMRAALLSSRNMQLAMKTGQNSRAGIFVAGDFFPFQS